MSLLVDGATIIDGVGARPISDGSIWIEKGRIRAIGHRDNLKGSIATEVIDARGKFVIPGLMNANVHLLSDVRLENLARYFGRFEDLIGESAQIALKNGVTTVFDTWGPRHFLMSVRDQIERGELVGSRIFCAGNIVGLDGPMSEDFDFFVKAIGTASPAIADRINAIWVENVGRHLVWQTPDYVGDQVRAYISKGIDFVKYASNDHSPSGGAFLAFSPQAQSKIVEEAHGAGLTAQAHSCSVEGLRIAIEAGCDLIQHANSTGPVPIPPETLELLVARHCGAVIFPWTQQRMDWLMSNESYKAPRSWRVSDENARSLIRSGAQILLATDGAIYAPDAFSAPSVARVLVGVSEDESLFSLSSGHFYWLRAMEEKGHPPMEMLKAATRNIAVAYGKDRDLGTLEVGKIADLLILDKNPLDAAQNYRCIHTVIKAGTVVERDSLPTKQILTKSPEPKSESEESYIRFLQGDGKHPICPTCSGE